MYKILYKFAIVEYIEEFINCELIRDLKVYITNIRS